MIIVNLHVAGVRRPLRALLHSGATNSFFYESCLSMLPPSIQIREGPAQIIIKLAEGRPHRVAQREVSLPDIFDDFLSDYDFLVVAMNHAFNCILDML